MILVNISAILLQPWEWQKLHMQECRNKIEEIRNDSCHKELTSSYPTATMLENVFFFFFLVASGALLQVCLFTLIQMYSAGLAAYEQCLLLTHSTFPLYPLKWDFCSYHYAGLDLQLLFSVLVFVMIYTQKNEGKRRRGSRWDGKIASPALWTWIWANSGRCWWTEEPACCSSWGCRESDLT